MTRADNPQGLRRSLNGAPVDDPESQAASMLPPRPPAPAHELRIRVYDYCREHGPHTDPDLAAIEAGL